MHSQKSLIIPFFVRIFTKNFLIFRITCESYMYQKCVGGHQVTPQEFRPFFLDNCNSMILGIAMVVQISIYHGIRNIPKLPMFILSILFIKCPNKSRLTNFCIEL